MKSYKNLFANLFMLFAVMVGLSSYLLVGHVSAVAGTLDTRSIQLSSSANGANNVKMSVSFRTGQTGLIGSMIMDFCTEDPIPGDTCTAPTSMDVNKSTIGTPTNQVGVVNWTTDTTNSNTHCLLLTRTPASVSAATTISFNMGDGTTTGIKNPATTNTTFYVRMITFTTTVSSCSSNPVGGTALDSGGIALSTTAQLTVNSKVQEQLAFCVYTGGSCGTLNPIALGDAQGILSTSGPYTDVSGHFTASTNAANGMEIWATGTTLTSAQSNTIAAIGATAAASAPGTEQFGFCISTSGGSVNGVSPYTHANCSGVTTGLNHTNGSTFAYDTSSSCASSPFNLTCVGGQKIASASGPSATTTGTIAYMANISPTTKAGLYTETQTFIAVGKY